MSGDGSNPFVGLRAFESHESLLFFGRQEQTRDLLTRLHEHHFVAVIGSSGSGKSSIIRAGLIPALKAGYLVNDRDSWMISIMKPGQSPICNLAEAILAQTGDSLTDLTATDLEQLIKEEGADALLEILKPLWGSNKSFFLLIDQFEELFRFSLNQPDAARKDEAIDFVNILLELSSQVGLPVYTVITMRSDFIGDCAEFYGLPEAINTSQYLVPRLTRIQLKSAIEGPVRLSNGRISNGLLTRLLNDAQTVKDELPLLQHALMRIWDRDRKDDSNGATEGVENKRVKGELDLKDYESIGGLEKALSNHADEALEGMTPRELLLTKKMFQALTTVDENERKVRRPVRLMELQALTEAGRAELLKIIDCFVENKRSFLIVTLLKDKDDELIDISHESLIRQWKTLNDWVSEEADSAKVLLRLDESATLFRNKEKDLLTGNELHQALHWYQTFKPEVEWAKRYHTDFEYSISYLKESELEEKKQRARKIRNRILLFASVIFVLILVSIFAFYVYRSGIRQKRELALNYWKSSLASRKSNDLLESMHYLAESIDITDDADIKRDLLIDAEASLPLTSLAALYPVADIISDVQFNAGNTNMLIALNDGTALVMGSEKGDIKATLRHQRPVNTAVFSNNGQYILTSSNDHEAIIWNSNNYQKVKVLTHPSAVNSAVFSPDGNSVLTAGADSCIRMWNAQTGVQLFVLRGQAPVINVLFSPDGSRFLTTGSDNIANIYNTQSHKAVIIQHDFPVRAATFSPDGKTIVTTGTDSSIHFLDAFSGAIQNTVKLGAVTSNTVFSANGKWLATAGKDGSVRLLSAVTGIQAGAVMKHDGPVYGIAFRADGQHIATGGWDKTLRLWKLLSPVQPLQTRFFRHNAQVNGAVFSNDEHLIVTASNDSTARVWNVDSMHTNEVVLRHDNYVNRAVFSNDDKMIITASNDSTATIWSEKGKKLQVLRHPAAVVDASFSRDGSRIVTVASDQYVRIWNYFSAGSKLVDSFNHSAFVYSAVFHPDNLSLLIACGDSAAYRVNASTGKIIASFRHDDVVKTAVFNDDATQVLTASWDMTSHVWDALTGTQIGTSMQHDSYVNSAAFSKGGNMIITSAWDNTARTWNVLTRQEIGVPLFHGGAVNSAVFSSNGEWILTSCMDSNAAIRRIAGDLDLPTKLFHLQAKVVSGAYFDVATDEARCIQGREWLRLRDDYEKRAAAHYRACRFRAYNFWGRLHPKEAENVAAGK